MSMFARVGMWIEYMCGSGAYLCNLGGDSSMGIYV